MTASDHTLMIAVQNGELDQLGILFERHNRHLYNFFFRQTGDSQISEDLAQDVFYRMLKYRHTYRAEGKFTTWMFSIAHNVKIDHFRKNRLPMDALDELHPVQDREPNPEETMVLQDESSLIMKALDRLPQEKREILLLSKMQNIQYEEIAEILGCRIGTVKARVFRALKELSEAYQEITKETSHAL